VGGLARLRCAAAAGIANIDWLQADPATAALDSYDLLASAFGLMFFGDPVAAFAHMRRAASDGARMAARRMWTARACACPVRCGWSAARPPERGARLGHASADSTPAGHPVCGAL
jgi:hypothetical protein